MTIALVLGVLLALACVLLVAYPFLADPEARRDRLEEPGELERRQIELLERRDRALAALKELEFDHRSGKISDEDYRELVGPLRREAADALRALEPRAEGQPSRVRTPHGREEKTMPIEPPTHPNIPEPYPPPGELDPPTPPQVPEPYPPPGEADPPAPPQIPEPYPPSEPEAP